MKKRSYQQFCPLAYSLDIIGERWTLLIVREFSLGARRYSDLQRGLPGIGPNLLSNRLKELEQHHILKRVYYPPPAKATAYDLTARGKALLAALMPLAQWGTTYLTFPPAEGDFLSNIATMGSLHLLFAGVATKELRAEIRLLPDIFTVTIANNQLAISQGHAVEPDLILHTEPKTLLALLAQMLPIEEGLRGGQIVLKQGETAVLNQFTQQFRAFPPTPN